MDCYKREKDLYSVLHVGVCSLYIRLFAPHLFVIVIEIQKKHTEKTYRKNIQKKGQIERKVKLQRKYAA